MLSRFPWFTRYRERRLEYAIALYTLGFGLFILIPGTAMRVIYFGEALHFAPEWAWGIGLSAIGALHAYALHINGRAAWTPFARFVVLFFNMQIFTALAIAVAHRSPLSTGVFTYGFLAGGFCGMAIYSAGVDCGREAKIWLKRRRNGGT